MQIPIGIIADKLNRNNVVAGIGCVFVCVAYGLTGIPLMATIIVGLGNGMFHIGSGIDVLNISEKKSTALGIFVSPGAFGIYFGTLLGRADVFLSIPIVIALLSAAVPIFAMQRIRGDTVVSNAPFSPLIPPKLVIAVLCLFLVVCMRSYVGLDINFPWRGVGYWGLALVSASAFGKTFGGILSDRFGYAKTTVLSLCITSALFLIPQIPLSGVTAIFLFNMTMPITLWAMARIFPGAKGFSFGLLTFALFLGFLPVYLGAENPSNTFWIFSLAALISIVLLFVGLRKVKT